MVFTSREKAFCVLKYARTGSNKTFLKVTNSKVNLDLAKKIQRRRRFVQSKRTWTNNDMTCTILQAGRTLNICEIFHGAHVPLNFLVKSTGINLILVNTKRT